jgi:hypothetical protein
LTNLATLTRTRMKLALRNKMFFFFSVIMPLGFFFLYAGIFAKGDPKMVLFYLGPVLALNVMGSFWGLSATLVMYREQGILRRFHVAPVTSSDMLISSVLANFVLTLPTVLSILLLARFVFHVPNFGNIWAMFLFVWLARIGRRQRDQHHAGNSGAQPIAVASADFLKRRNSARGIPFQSRSTRGPFPAGNVFSQRSSASHLCVAIDHPAIDAIRFFGGMGSPFVFCCHATISLGAGNQNSAKRQALGCRNRNSLHPLGFLGAI